MPIIELKYEDHGPELENEISRSGNAAFQRRPVVMLLRAAV